MSEDEQARAGRALWEETMRVQSVRDLVFRAVQETLEKQDAEAREENADLGTLEDLA